MIKFLFIMVFLITSCNVSAECPPVPVPPIPPGTPPQPPSTQIELKWQINQARVSRGLPMLTSTTGLDCAAVIHATDMEANRLCSHNGSDNSRFWERAKKCGTRAAGEIIACGYKTEAAVVQAWLRSPGHAAIIMDSRNVSMGASRVGDYWVMVFMK